MQIMLSILLITTIIAVVGSQRDFCKAWIANNYKIDFGYQAYPYDHEFYNFWYMIIGKSYWHLKYDMDKDSIYFADTMSREFNLPGDQYRVAIICQNCLKNETVYTGLLKKNENKVDWMQIDLDKKTGQLTTDGKVIQTNPDLDFGAEFNPSIGFDAFPNGFIFIQIKPNDGKKKYKLTYRGFGYNRSQQKFFDETVNWKKSLKEYMDWLKVKYSSDDTILDNIVDRHNYMAVFNPAPSILYNPFVIILFEAEHMIFYCFAREKLMNKGCNTDRHPVRKLIDCSNEA